ncbi:Large subunit GTPase 1 [Mycena venus]|uniref:Large subunit GTPase 1 n=1 Tax=Mycena venus TaxID=2733690 RepID=A0A8H6XEV0_9AGAR|nr:Large subunit GTPase 1 [Mycena venus]
MTFRRPGRSIVAPAFGSGLQLDFDSLAKVLPTTTMPPRRDLNPSGLGRAIINKKAKDAKRMQESGLYVTDADSTSRLKSVTQEADLDEFLNTAQLAGTDFTAERRNVKIIQQSAGSSQNPYLLTEQEEITTLKKHQENKKRLRVPRRPAWTKSMTPAELEKQEKTAFLDWRRGLASLQEEDKFLLTPFERNLEVWRQLWRVLERSHLVVQIVDARNPLRFRCEDLEAYVHDVEGAEGESGTGKGKRRCLLLINKADLLTAQQRCLWADHFDKQGIQYAFFSAANAAALQQARRDALERQSSTHNNDENLDDEEEGDEEADEPEEEELSDENDDESDSDAEDFYFSAEEDSPEGQDPRAKVLSVLELESLFEKAAPDLSVFSTSTGQSPTKLVVGLVGYPNVGKSSTINSLLGEKKVSVSSTPGKTKHFQTINLSDSMTLCDCPGLVFPQFATTKADLICDGVLPIDQMKEHTGPAALVVKRIPKEVLEATYGLTIKIKGVDEGGDGQVTAENFLIAYAIGRGYTRSGQGNPDEARAARYIMKDYVNAKLLYCHPPPGIPEGEFNKRTHELAMLRFADKKRAPVTRVGKGADTFVPSNVSGNETAGQPQGLKSRALDQNFFENNSTLSSRPFIQGSGQLDGKTFSRSRTYPHQNAVADDGRTRSHLTTKGCRCWEKRSSICWFPMCSWTSVRCLRFPKSLSSRTIFFSPNTITLLVVHYGLLNHIRCLPDKASIFLNAPEEASSILYAYIGGIYVDHGDKPLRTVIQSWMNFVLALNVPPQKKIKMEETDRELRSPATSALGVSPTQLPNPLTPAQPNLPFLASFNQTSSKRGVTLDYPGTYDHVQKLWTVQCVVDGIIKGTGSGSSKSVAKELAARHAYQTMGWV